MENALLILYNELLHFLEKYLYLGEKKVYGDY